MGITVLKNLLTWTGWYKPKNITKEGLIDVSAELLQHFIAQGRTPAITMDTSSQDIKQFMFQPLEERH
jgi:hypothetical protein